MKDYYSILEINESASKETIEKVHKLLIKKYHPDLQPDNQKQEAEQMMKEINEAYEVLTNPEKKKRYDEDFKEYKINEIMKEIKQNSKENQYDDNYTQQVATNEQQYDNNLNSNEQGPFNVTDEEIRRQAQVYYDELYRQYLYRNGYIRDYKATFKNYVALFLTIALTIGIIYILFKIPYFKNIFEDIINSNEILKILFERLM